MFCLSLTLVLSILHFCDRLKAAILTIAMAYSISVGLSC